MTFEQEATEVIVKVNKYFGALTGLWAMNGGKLTVEGGGILEGTDDLDKLAEDAIRAASLIRMNYPERFK